MWYSLDGAAYTHVDNWSSLGDATYTLVGDNPDDGDWVSTTITISSLSPTTSIRLKVVMDMNAGTEQMQLDNVEVKGTATSSGTSIVESDTGSEPSSISSLNGLLVIRLTLMSGLNC